MASTLDHPDGHGADEAHRTQPGPPAKEGRTARADWYPDPLDPDLMRYWNGQFWSDDTAPAIAVTTASNQRRPVIAGIVGGGIGGLLAMLWSLGVFEAAADWLGDSTAPALTAAPGADWETTPVLNGSATVASDPDWQPADAYVDLNEMSAGLTGESDIAISADAAWVVDTDADGNVSILVVCSLWEGDPGIDPEHLNDDVIASWFPGKTDMESVSRQAFSTASGLSGFESEFTYELAGSTYTDTSAVIVEGSDRVFFYLASGSASLGSGRAELEAVANSLAIEG